jgi:hypothetical protein
MKRHFLIQNIFHGIELLNVSVGALSKSINRNGAADVHSKCSFVVSKHVFKHSSI